MLPNIENKWKPAPSYSTALSVDVRTAAKCPAPPAHTHHGRATDPAAGPLVSGQEASARTWRSSWTAVSQEGQCGGHQLRVLPCQLQRILRVPEVLRRIRRHHSDLDWQIALGITNRRGRVWQRQRPGPQKGRDRSSEEALPVQVLQGSQR